MFFVRVKDCEKRDFKKKIILSVMTLVICFTEHYLNGNNSVAKNFIMKKIDFSLKMKGLKDKK